MSAPRPVTTKPAWQRAASRVAGIVGVRYYTMLYGERSLLGEIERIEARLDLDVRAATPPELERIRGLMSSPDAYLAGRAVEQGGECLVAWDGETVAGYSWLNRERITLLGDPVCELVPGGGYTFFSFVWPEYRGKRVFQALTGAVYSRLKAEGFRFCCNLVDRNNAGSIGARAKYGVVYQPAPILKLPGLHPRVIGRPFRMGVTLDSR